MKCSIVISPVIGDETVITVRKRSWPCESGCDSTRLKVWLKCLQSERTAWVKAHSVTAHTVRADFKAESERILKIMVWQGNC